MIYPWYKKLNPIWWFGNENDGNCGSEKFITERCKNICNLWCKIKWGWRNPLHNFCFYVIGIADRTGVVYKSLHGQNIHSSEDGQFNLGYIKWKYLYLPIISYNGYKYEWYIGWRPNGSFGIAFRKTDSISM